MKTERIVPCVYCDGSGTIDADIGRGGSNFAPCGYCSGTGSVLEKVKLIRKKKTPATSPQWQEKPTSAGLWVYVVNPEAESHPGILVRVYKEQIATGITTNFTPVYGPIPEFNSKETK